MNDRQVVKEAMFVILNSVRLLKSKAPKETEDQTVYLATMGVACALADLARTFDISSEEVDKMEIDGGDK